MNTNAILLAIDMYSDADNKKIVATLTESIQPTQKWYNHSSKSTKSTSEAQKWLIEETQGNFMDHVKETFGKIEDASALQRVGLILPVKSEGLGFDSHHDLVMEQDHWANLFGESTTSMGSRRMERTLSVFRGWPVRFGGFLSKKPGLPRHTMDEFQLDRDGYDECKSKENFSKEVKALLERSLFEQVSVKQHCEVLERKRADTPERAE